MAVAGNVDWIKISACSQCIEIINIILHLSKFLIVNMDLRTSLTRMLYWSRLIIGKV